MKELTPKQLQVAALLASGATKTAAAKDVDITRETIHQWLKTDDAFIAHLNGLKHEIIDSRPGGHSNIGSTGDKHH